MLNETDITMIFGMRGSGKSTLTRRLSSVYPRRIVFDRLHEWNEGIIFKSFLDFGRLWAENYDKESFTLVFQADIEAGNEQQSDVFNQILRVIYKTCKMQNAYSPIFNTCLIFEEIHFYGGAQFIEPWLWECVLTGRHAGLAIIGNSQRPASVHKSLVSQSANLFVGQLYEPRDMQYLSEAMGQDAFKAKTLPKFSFVFFRPGVPATIVS